MFWSAREFPVPALLPPPGFVEIAVSKRKLYDALRETGLVPRYSIVSRDDLLARRGLELDGGSRSGSATTATRRRAGSARSR